MKNEISYLIISLLMLLSGVGAKAQTTCYVLSNHSLSVSSWGTSDAIELSGPGCQVTFKAQKNMSTAVDPLILSVSTDNKKWSEVFSIKVGDLNKNSYKSFSYGPLDTEVRYIRFKGGSYRRDIIELYVTRATTLSSSATSIDFGTLDGVGATSTKTINVAYNNTLNPTNLSGSCTDGQFTVTGKSMGETGNTDISVKYTPTSIGNHSGKVTLTMGSATYQFDVSGNFTGNRFNFSASAQSSNGSFGSASATVANAEIHNLTTSASTTATFTATPASGCTFNGWYDNSGYTGNPVSTSATYQVTLTNNTVNSTASRTLYAKFKKNQTLSWNNSFDAYTIINGTTVANGATASSGLAVTYSSSNTDAVTVDADGTLHGVSLGKSTVTASQPGNDDYNPATSIWREFSVLDKLQPVFTPSFSGTQTEMKVGQSATISLANVTGAFTCSVENPDIIGWSRSDNTITLTALKTGSTTLSLNEPGNAITNPTSAVYTINVSKWDNTLAVDMASLETTVGGTLPVTFTLRNNNDTPIVGAVSNQVLSSSVNNGSDVISYSDGIVTALNAGTATIMFSQAATDRYNAATVKSFEITVLKNANSISVTIDGVQRNSINLARNASVPFAYSSASDAPYSVVITSGNESIASISGSNITTHNTDGTVIWNISQAETYKYEAAASTVRVKVNSTPEAEGYVLVHDDDLALNTIQTGPSMALSGPGNILSFDASRAWNFSGTSYLVVEYSTNGGSSFSEWQRPNLGTSSAYYSYTLPDNVTHVRFKTVTGATLVTHVQNVKVTRKTYVRASSDKSDLGTVKTGNTATATLTVDWSSTNGGDISVESSNPAFTASPATITGTANKDARTAVTVTFTPDPDKLGAEETTITVSDLFYSQEIVLTATAAKQETSITANYEASTASSLKVEGAISNAFTFSGVSAAVPSSSQSDDFYYVIDHHVTGSATGSSHPGEVVSYDPATNTISALNAGTATVTFHQKSTALYNATSASFEFVVVKHDQFIAWDNEITDFTLKKGQSLNTNTATASSGLAVTYSSSNTLSIMVDADTGELTATGAGADVEIIATQAGNYKYNSASVSRKFTVYAQSTPVFTPSFDETAASVRVDDSVTILLENVSDSLDGDFTVTSSNEGIVNWSREGDVLTIVALAEGETVVTLTQKGNDDYLAKTVGYTFTVTYPDDYAVLDPVEALPGAGTYRKVILRRNIPAGLSTISLPFDTSLAALVAGSSNAGAKLYVLCNVGVDDQKGYMFYFNEVKDGVISAGVPYVLYLENEVNGAEFAATGGIALKSSEQMEAVSVISCGGWKMVSNFNAALPMANLYGVVNGSANGNVDRIMRGGAGSSVNAYSAYFRVKEAVSTAGETSGTKAMFTASAGKMLFNLPIK